MNESHNEANVGKFELIETDTSRDTYPISAKQNREFNLFLPLDSKPKSNGVNAITVPINVEKKAQN